MRLYWSVQENVPVISRKCTEREVRVVPTSKTSDPRPATEADLELLRRVLDEQFGSGTYNELIRSEVVLFGRAPYLDTAYEVISDGGVLGHLFFDLYEMKWYFKPLEQSIDRIGHRMEFLHLKGRRGEVLGESHGGPKFKLLENGLAERIGGKYVVVRVFKEREGLLEERNSWYQVLRVNEACILADESKAIRFVWRASRRAGKTIVSFSGGKDSSALLEVVRRSGVDHLIYFNDTGLELPETLKFVGEVGYDIVGDAGDSFWRNVGRFGPPARDYRWCCKVIKLLPTYRALKSLAPGLTLVGQRKFESSARMRSPPIWRNRWLPGFLTGAPINEWSALETWLYLRLRSVRVNPLYERGFERLGCYLCPASRLSEFEKLKDWYPDLWERWFSFLSEYASKRNLDECWVKYGLWRWIRPPQRMRVLCPEVRDALVTIELSEGLMKVDPFDEGAFLSLAHSLAVVRDGRVISENFEAEVVDPKSGLLRYTGDVERLKGLIARSACTGCGVCKEYCEFGAIEIGEKARISPDKCTKCGICGEVCPLSFYKDRIVEVRPADI